MITLVILHRILGLIVVVLVGLSCQKDSPADATSDPGVAIPLEGGNTWQYEHMVLDTNGLVTYSSTLTMTVVYLDTFDTETGYHIENFVFNITHPGPVLWTNKSDGVYDIVGKPLPFPPDVHRALPFPTFPGDSILYGGYTIRTRTLNEVVIVTAGSFNCVSYDLYSAQTLVAQIFLTPNVGIIKAWQQYGLSRVIDKLESYQSTD